MKIPYLTSSKNQTFKLLYEEYYAPFCIYAKRFIDDIETCEDIVSDVFTALWDSIDTIDLNSGTEIGYIKTSVKNKCLNYLKHQEHKRNYENIIQTKTSIYETTPDSVYTLKELYQLLYETLDKLPENYRKVFIKRFFQEKTYGEIAEELNISTKSVNRYKKKTLELLRNELKEYRYIFF